MSEDAMQLKYVGGGEHLEGVPARDLSDDEYAALGKQQQGDVLKCGLYEVVQPEPPAAPQKVADKAPTTEKGGED